MRNILLDDLQHSITAIKEQDGELVAEVGGSPFCKEIQETLLPERFELLNINAYEEKAEPQHHLDYFNDLIKLLMKDICKVFTVTLSNRAKKWLRSMTPGPVTNWQQLSTLFLRQFQATKQFAMPLAHLGNVK